MKITRKIVSACIALFLIIVSIAPAYAETIYIVNGYSYSIYRNDAITLEGWDTSIDSNLVLPDSLGERYFVNVANWAFEENTELTGLDFSQATHLSRIGYESFIGCSNISTPIVLPPSLINLNERSFSGCSLVPYINIYANILSIPRECFYGCSSAESVILPSNLQSIESWAFGDCTSLRYVEIPKSMTSIAPSAFKNDSNLTLGVWYGSYGYEYAKAQNIPYVLLDSALLGDANGDGYVNVNDVTAIQRHAAELELLEGINFHAADINGDGNVSVDDATELQRFLAEYVVDYPIGEVMTQ